ncbi:ABC-2 type transport system ATP-binding protein [Pelagirhabdus alkalitolerans]|uniref:ABC-2 type transport system ATP-binding protein n=1 Tax=Pelagirhabdus alkalitolerans TaxID=1612202 RepID=A0A1G6IVI2_9BACI|nr:ABC transporter ATP-binding protein [Pelagirhabdus alkalitolerans]SDC09776.1 ABC-2 type transport system ATP-binding protein [Pelagirhabdus alkalitolerans]
MNKEPILELSHLSIQFTGKQVLDSINLKVNAGEIIGYIGPNGAGKSTTVKIILGLLSSYKGEVKVFGEIISDKSIDYKRKIGYVPENGELYDDLTAKEYIDFVGQMYGLTMETIDKKLPVLFDEFDLYGVRNKRIGSFSKGMKQKLLIVASLIHNPDLIFFDEPLNGLDANSVMVIKDMMKKLRDAGKTIFYSSHIMDVVEKISDRIILLNQGNIVADGSFEELKAKNEEGSLEDIFNQLTGFDSHGESAENIVSVIQGVEADV